MKSLPWIVAGVAVGFAAWLFLNTPTPQYATGSRDLEDAADRANRWGTKQRFTGAGRNLAGQVKEGFGRVTGDYDLADEGVVDQVAGSVKDAAGNVAHAVGDTIHEINR
jgi:uncharacterized protein YjbJ (UPF0337 family)